MTINGIKKFADRIPHNWLASGFAVACFILYMTNRNWLRDMAELPDNVKEIMKEQEQQTNDIQHNTLWIQGIKEDQNEMYNMQEVEHLRINKHLELIESKLPNGELTGGIKRIEEDIKQMQELMERRGNELPEIDGSSINLEYQEQGIKEREMVDEEDSDFICFINRLFG